MRFVSICFSCVSIFPSGAALAADTSNRDTNKKIVVVVEHRDAIQPIPEQSANSNGMF